MEPILKRVVLILLVAAADLGIPCERCSQALTWSDREGSGSLPLSQARVEQKWRVKESHWRISVASKHTCIRILQKGGFGTGKG